MITVSQLQRLKTLIASGEQYKFYSWRAWRDHIRPEVFKLDNSECQHCKARGRYSPGYIAHHINHIENRPDLALSIYDETGERNIIVLCKSCHENEHPEALKKTARLLKKPVTVERWD